MRGKTHIFINLKTTLRGLEADFLMDFYEVIRTRRSIRSYKPDPIPDDVLTRILGAARIAPSGSNRQPWKFIVVRDEELKRRLAIACHNQMFIAEAPVVIVACGYDIHWNKR